MGAFSTFGMHFEDYAFGSANVIIAEPGTQAWAIWYHVPRGGLSILHEFLRDHLGASTRKENNKKQIVSALKRVDRRVVRI
eukprot:1080533-Pyramimonas_sp.AAC.1